LPSGEFEHLGRFDDQVKVRGFRIELGEIDAALTHEPDVQAAASFVWTAGPDDVRIVACCVPMRSGSISPINLRRHLRTTLPDYMIPQHFIPIGAIPLGPSGKVDRRQLPTPVLTESRLSQVEAVSDSTEEAIADIWTKLLRPARAIGRSDRFFEMGGHSLLALEAIRQIDERFGVRLNARVLFLETVAEMAVRCRTELEDGPTGEPVSTGPIALSSEAPRRLTHRQEEIYREWQVDYDSGRFHLPYGTLLRGVLDIDSFRSSLIEVFERHPALRTVVTDTVDGPRQSVRAAHEVCDLEIVDVSDQLDPAGEALRLMEERLRLPFDLRKGPLVRLMLVRITDAEHYWFMMPHEVFFDGWSFDIVLAELDQVYGALELTDKTPRPGSTVTFADFATWQREQPPIIDEATRDHWKSVLIGWPTPIVWPTEGQSGAPNVERIAVEIDEGTAHRLEVVAEVAGVGVHTVLLAAFAGAIAELTGRDDLVIGVATSGRYVPEALKLVGLFFNVQPLRFSIRPEVSGQSLLNQVRAVTQAAMAFQEVLPHQLAEISASVNNSHALTPQITFSYQDSRRRLRSIGSLASAEIRLPRAGLSTELEFWVLHTPRGFVGGLDYAADKIDARVVRTLATAVYEQLSELTQGEPSDRS
jgi:hypothetical protein